MNLLEVEEGVTGSLTAGTDTFGPSVGSSANVTTVNDDTFRAVNAGDLGTADYIDGGAGADTLNATSITGAATMKPVLKNVETINMTFTAGDTLDMADSSGYTALNSKTSTAAAIFTNIALNTKVGVIDNAQNATFTYANATGSSDSATLVLQDGGAAVTIANIETLNIESGAGSLSATTNNTATLTATSAKSIVVTGAQALTLGVTLTGGSVDLASVDASAATGALSLTTTGAAIVALTAKGGSGADSLNLVSATGKANTVNAGAGNDTITVAGDKAHQITGGEGNDLYIVGANAAGDVKNLAATDTTNDKLKAAAITITDFGTGTDKLSINDDGTYTRVSLTGTELSSAAAQTTLDAALIYVINLKSTNAANTDVAAFAWGGDTYVFFNNTADGAAGGVTSVVDAADGLIRLVGYTTDLTTTNLTFI